MFSRSQKLICWTRCPLLYKKFGHSETIRGRDDRDDVCVCVGGWVHPHAVHIGNQLTLQPTRGPDRGPNMPDVEHFMQSGPVVGDIGERVRARRRHARHSPLCLCFCLHPGATLRRRGRGPDDAPVDEADIRYLFKQRGDAPRR